MNGQKFEKVTTAILSAVIVIGVLFVLGLALWTAEPPTPTVAIQTSASPTPVDFGNGVFYFPYHGSEFGKQFSTWRASHPKWIIIAVTSSNDPGDGTQGYFVIANPDL